MTRTSSAVCQLPVPFVAALGTFSVLLTLSVFGGLATDSADFFRTHALAWTMTVLATPAFTIYAASWRKKPLDRWWRWFWTFGWIASLVHFGYGLFALHGGKPITVFERQGFLLAFSIFFFTALWGADVIASWSRRNWSAADFWLSEAAFVVGFLTFFISTVIFQNDLPSLIVGLAMTVSVAIGIIGRYVHARHVGAGARWSSMFPLVAAGLGAAFVVFAPLALGDVMYWRTRISIWVAVALATPAVTAVIADIRRPVDPRRAAAGRVWWTLGLAGYGVHLWYGLGIMMVGSVSTVIALQGWVVGLSNLALAALWGASVIVAWAAPGRFRWLHMAAGVFFIVSTIGSTLVFGRMPSPVVGGIFVTAIAAGLLVALPSVLEVIMTFQAPILQSGQPVKPRIGTSELLWQFWKDIYGKEVQSAATYSYLWMADQMGHVCIGIILDFALTLVVERVLGFLSPGDGDLTNTVLGFLISSVIVSLWEASAYRSSVQESTWPQLLDGKTLKRNAIIAAGYMIVGVGLGFAFHLDSAAWAVGISLVLVVIAVILSPPWLRQKIIWQKASLPYLVRLADAKRSFSDAEAACLKTWVADGVPSVDDKVVPAQMVLSGPVGSGRTSLATGIGSEFAFRHGAVRYLTFDKLIEFAATSKPGAYADDPGPQNIGYWPWSNAQVLIIDDIGPVVSGHPPIDPIEDFKARLNGPLKNIQAELGMRHTVWVFGDLDKVGNGHEAKVFADLIAAFCGAAKAPMVMVLQPRG